MVQSKTFKYDARSLPDLNTSEVINIFIITLNPTLIRIKMIDNSAIKVIRRIAIWFEDEWFPGSKLYINFLQYSEHKW